MDFGYVFFVLKKLLGGLLMPVPLILMSSAFGLILVCHAKRRAVGILILFFTFLFFAAVTNQWVSTKLIWPFEHHYPPLPEVRDAEHMPSNLKACQTIVVLGSGNAFSPGIAALDDLSYSALARAAETARLARLLPNAKIIFTGWLPDNRPSHAVIMKRAVISLGVDFRRISTIEGGRDTDDEAQKLAELLHDQPVALITSAWHMPRAAALCTKRGMNVIPVPTDFMTKPPANPDEVAYLWDIDSLFRSTLAFREALGMVWTKLRGQT